jgi:hypothetical protein
MGVVLSQYIIGLGPFVNFDITNGHKIDIGANSTAKILLLNK